MEITKIPFIDKVGITKNQQGVLVLAPDSSVRNHLNTIHAGALFCLAETASGEALLKAIPEYVGVVVPVLRDSRVKYRKPATCPVCAYAQIDEKDILNSESNLRRAIAHQFLLTWLLKMQGALICAGGFSRFVQNLET